MNCIDVLVGGISVADPGFPRGGGANPKGGGANLLFGQFFLKTACQDKGFE